MHLPCIRAAGRCLVRISGHGPHLYRARFLSHCVKTSSRTVLARFPSRDHCSSVACICPVSGQLGDAWYVCLARELACTEQSFRTVCRDAMPDLAQVNFKLPSLQRSLMQSPCIRATGRCLVRMLGMCLVAQDHSCKLESVLGLATAESICLPRSMSCLLEGLRKSFFSLLGGRMQGLKLKVQYRRFTSGIVQATQVGATWACRLPQQDPCAMQSMEVLGCTAQLDRTISTALQRTTTLQCTGWCSVG